MKCFYSQIEDIQKFQNEQAEKVYLMLGRVEYIELVLGQLWDINHKVIQRLHYISDLIINIKFKVSLDIDD